MSLQKFMKLVWVLAVLLGSVPKDSLGGQSTNSRLAQIDSQLTDTRVLLADTTNEAERVQWQQRLDLLQQDRSNLQQRVELEEKEQTLALSRKRLAISVLRETLSSIDADIAAAEHNLTRLEKTTLEAKAARVELEQARQQAQSNAEANPEKLAELDQRLRTKDEELMALSLEHDTATAHLHLITEARRIEQYLQNEPPNPGITFGAIRDKRRLAHAAKVLIGNTDEALALCRERQGDIAAALQLSQEKVAHMDAELALLDKKRHGVRDWFAMRPLFYAANMEKKYLSQRVEFQQKQVAAIGEATIINQQLRNLSEKELAFLTEDLSSLISRFWRRLSVPCISIILILLAHSLFYRLILPVFFHKEHWIVGRRISGYVSALLIILALAIFFFEDLRSVATIIGIASAAIVIALQDVCSAFAGWFMIVASKKFAVGHRVEIDGHCGDVIDIQLLRTTLAEVNNWLGVDEPTGRIIVIPNSFVFKSKFFNYTHMHTFLSHKLDVTMTYETPFTLASEMLMRVVEEETRQEFDEARKAFTTMDRAYGVQDFVTQPKLFTFLADSGVMFRIVYVAHYRRGSSTRTRINNRILQELERDRRLQLAYPTQRQIYTDKPPMSLIISETGKNH